MPYTSTWSAASTAPARALSPGPRARRGSRADPRRSRRPSPCLPGRGAGPGRPCEHLLGVDTTFVSRLAEHRNRRGRRLGVVGAASTSVGVTPRACAAASAAPARRRSGPRCGAGRRPSAVGSFPPASSRWPRTGSRPAHGVRQRQPPRRQAGTSARNSGSRPPAPEYWTAAQSPVRWSRRRVRFQR